MKTTFCTAQTVEERWLLFDASEHVLGHMSTQIAMAILGKDRPSYTPSQKTGAFVVVINAKQARVTGKKETQKIYENYSLYPGGLKLTTLERMRERKPEEIVRLAVRRMLPKSDLGRQLLTRLKVYSGSEHPHSAQQPLKVEPKHKVEPKQ